MKISILNPTHKSSHLEELYDSIKYQDFYEWIIIENSNAKTPQTIVQDSRVKIWYQDSPNNYVGQLKKFACERATGDILLEVYHDDLLTPTAIEEVKKTFEDPEVGFVYSLNISLRCRLEIKDS